MVFVYTNPLHEPADDSFDMDEKERVSSPHTSDFLAVASRDVESLDIDEIDSVHPVRHGRLRSCCRWTRWLLLASLAASAAIGLALYLGPIFLEKVIVPVMGWEVAHLSKPVMALVAIACLAFLPLFFLPTGPTLWVVGIIFGYLWGFPLLYFGVFLGQTFPYFIGHWLLHDRIQGWLSKDPRNAALLKLAEQGGWMHQFRVVVLLRVSPFPYALFNYAVTATNIEYAPYIAASMVAQIPECLLAIYCGRLIKTLADFHHQQQRRLTPLQMASQGAGLLIAVSIAALGMFYGNRALRELEAEEAAGRVLQVGGARSRPFGYRVSGTKEGMGWFGVGVSEGLSWGMGRVEGRQTDRGMSTSRGGGGGEGGSKEDEKGKQLESMEELGMEGGQGGDGDRGGDCELELYSVESGEEAGCSGEREGEESRNSDVSIPISGFGVGPTTAVGEGVRGLLGMGKEEGWRRREGTPLLKEEGKQTEVCEG